jgi:cyclase
MPCLLLKGQGLVKTVRFRDARYIGDPINAVRIYNAREADELIFLDITASKERRKISFDLVRKIADETYMPFAVGGGIRDVREIESLLKTGTEKVVINSYAFENPAFIREASNMFGSQSIVVSIDARKTKGVYKIWIYGGTRVTDVDPVVFAQKMEDMGAGEIMINSIDKDGTMSGYDIDLVRMVADAVKVPVIACGGAGRLQDFVEARKEGKASAVAAGSLFVFHGPRRAVLINFPSKKELLNLFG